MALIGIGRDQMRSEHIFGWAFPMRSEDGNDVPVRVTDDALNRMAALDPSPPESRGDRFNKYRENVEKIASAKHTAGRIEADGTVKVTTADIQGDSGARF